MWEKLEKIRHILEGTIEFDLRFYRKILRKIRAFDFSGLSASELVAQLQRLKTASMDGKPADELLPEVYALTAEVSRRELGLSPFDTQLIAAIALHRGRMVEMRNGEGKTLAAVFPAVLNALSGRGVHIMTFNDYLAKRDALWMAPIYRFWGLAPGYIQESFTREERKRAYACDVTYMTAREAGFDFLRDGIVFHPDETVMRPPHRVIVDEADSILIDESRVPLVIAAEGGEMETASVQLASLVRAMKAGDDFETDEFRQNIYLTEKGALRLESRLGCGNLYEAANHALLTRITHALRAEFFLRRDVDYLVRDSKIEQVDEFTGRIAENRSWPSGLQRAVEEKEGLESPNRGRILGTCILQHLISLYPSVSGMTATAGFSVEEFKELFGLTTVFIPPRRKSIRIDHPDQVFTHLEAKNAAVVKEIVLTHETGRPLLVGTASVEESEKLAETLRKAGVACRVLNARNHEEEAMIIAEAGRPGAVTISTHMAGRGTDIRLGGHDESGREEAAAKGGLYVIGTSRYENRRADMQLRGRAGRQGDPGASCFFISLEDELMVQYGIRNLIESRFQPRRQDTPLDSPALRAEIDRAQRIIEGRNFELRRELFRFSWLLEQQRKQIADRRRDILLSEDPLSLLPLACKDLLNPLETGASRKKTAEMARTILLYHHDRAWADYLDYAGNVREGIHLTAIGGKKPVQEFHRILHPVFDGMESDIISRAENSIRTLAQNGKLTELETAGIREHQGVFTYLVNETRFDPASHFFEKAFGKK